MQEQTLAGNKSGNSSYIKAYFEAFINHIKGNTWHFRNTAVPFYCPIVSLLVSNLNHPVT